jgi:hypothetical protein
MCLIDRRPVCRRSPIDEHLPKGDPLAIDQVFNLRQPSP